MIDKEIEKYFTPDYFGNITWNGIEFAFAEGLNFEVTEQRADGSAKGILCNLEGELAQLNGKEIEVKPNILQNIQI